MPKIVEHLGYNSATFDESVRDLGSTGPWESSPKVLPRNKSNSEKTRKDIDTRTTKEARLLIDWRVAATTELPDKRTTV